MSFTWRVAEVLGVPGVAHVKMGGQALPDEVRMRTGRAWAAARADGSVQTGVVSVWSAS
jgi:hypothetical protein